MLHNTALHYYYDDTVSVYDVNGQACASSTVVIVLGKREHGGLLYTLAVDDAVRCERTVTGSLPPADKKASLRETGG